MPAFPFCICRVSLSFLLKVMLLCHPMRKRYPPSPPFQSISLLYSFARFYLMVISRTSLYSPTMPRLWMDSCVWRPHPTRIRPILPTHRMPLCWRYAYCTVVVYALDASCLCHMFLIINYNKGSVPSGDNLLSQHSTVTWGSTSTYIVCSDDLDVLMWCFYLLIWL